MNGNLFFNLIWLIFIISAFMPMLHQWRIEQARVRMIRALEEKRGTRLITLIHREEAISLLGIPLRRFINIEDSEAILRAIRLTPDDLPIDIILHTPGGLVLAAEQIAHAIRRHKGKVTVFVPHYAMSGGTLIALAADEIIMDENAVLGPMDPQLSNYPAVSILRAVEQKDKNEVDDEILILADVAAKAITQIKLLVHEILSEKMPPEEAARITEELTSGRWTHDYPITPEKLEKIGLKVTVGLPKEVYQLMELYPQSPGRRPSVQFIPVPYRRVRREGGERRE